MDNVIDHQGTLQFVPATPIHVTQTHDVWTAFALRRNLALLFLSAWAPLSFGLFLVARYRDDLSLVSISVGVIWLTATLASIWWAGECRCPRCCRRFGALGSKKGSTNLTRGFFDSVCANCKLRKFERAL